MLRPGRHASGCTGPLIRRQPTAVRIEKCQMGQSYTGYTAFRLQAYSGDQKKICLQPIYAYISSIESIHHYIGYSYMRMKND
jgi:hypothetical protein